LFLYIPRVLSSDKIYTQDLKIVYETMMFLILEIQSKLSYIQYKEKRKGSKGGIFAKYNFI